MAHIELSVGPWTARVDATDTDAVIAILVAYESYFGMDHSPEAEVRLQSMLEHLVAHVEEVARNQMAREAAEAARRDVFDSDIGKWAVTA